MSGEVDLVDSRNFPPTIGLLSTSPEACNKTISQVKTVIGVSDFFLTPSTGEIKVGSKPHFPLHQQGLLRMCF